MEIVGKHLSCKRR